MPQGRVCWPGGIGYSSERMPIPVGLLYPALAGPADVAQLVEHHLAKVRVAGSNPVVRSEVPDGSREPTVCAALRYRANSVTG